MNTQTLVSSKPSIVHVLKGTWRGVIHMWWFLKILKRYFRGEHGVFRDAPTHVIETYRFDPEEDLGRQARNELIGRGYKPDWPDMVPYE